MRTQGHSGRWYALAVTPGRESKIRKTILDRLERRGVTVAGLTLVCPEEEETRTNNEGKQERHTKVSLPGYILLHCRSLDETAIGQITGASGVLEFLGGNDSPTQLRVEEVERMLGSGSASTSAGRRSASIFELGDEVKIIEGSMADFSGVITELSEDSGAAKVEIEIFGRPTPTKVQIRQLRKA